MCGGYADDYWNSPCAYDTGAPVIERSSGLLVGIYGFEMNAFNDCGTPNQPSVFSRVSYYADWIAKIISEN